MQSQTQNQTSSPVRRSYSHDKDGLSRLITGLIVIWLGVTLYMNNQNWLDGAWWAYFIVGIGGLFLVESLVRISQDHTYPMYGKLIGGCVLIAVGAGNIYDMHDWWPLIFVAVGLAIIFINTRQHSPQDEGTGN